MNSMKETIKNFRQPFMVSVILMIVCGLLFPLVLTGISKVIFPYQAEGSLIEVNGVKIGSEHVGQDFTKPYFMKGRPSAVNYNTYEVKEDGSMTYIDGTEFGGLSSGSKNYAPTNPALVERVQNDIEEFLEQNPQVKREDIPTDLMTASGSGLDPHISPESAEIQIPAISQASGISEDELRQIVKDNTDGRLLGIFGEKTVNVLEVNLDIAEKMGLLK